MQKPLKKIITFLVIIILLPIIVFSIFEIGSLNNTERVIQSVYTKQLDAILFSVNQLSEDITNGWINKSEQATFPVVNKDSQDLKWLFDETPIFTIALLDSINDKNADFIIKKDSLLVQPVYSEENLQEDIRQLITNNLDVLKRLVVYKRNKYIKITPLKSNWNNNTTVLFFLSADSANNKVYALYFNSEKFVLNILAPKLQEIAENEFILSVFDKKQDKRIYSTENSDTVITSQQKNLWLIPDYNLGITLKGSSIEDVIQSRITFTFIIIAVLVIVLIAAGILLVRNINNEVKLAQIKADFLSNVSHELRTPLALISMFAETLEMDRVKTDEKKKEYYKIISQETTRLSKIVNKILNFSKMEAGKIKYNFEPCNLNDILLNISNVYSFHLKNNGFTFSIEYAEEKLLLNADKESISEAIINLIDNAVKYSKEKKEVNIKTGVEKEMGFVVVQDFGIGISKEEQTKIFEKFYRVSTGNVHNTKGTGLGLALVKHIIAAHNGRIEIHSQPGKGSTFKLLFPLINENIGVNNV
jgi:two-component system phosphate regulon sensor histidine kinase PhoR